MYPRAVCLLILTHSLIFAAVTPRVIKPTLWQQVTKSKALQWMSHHQALCIVLGSAGITSGLFYYLNTRIARLEQKYKQCCDNQAIFKGVLGCSGNDSTPPSGIFGTMNKYGQAQEALRGTITQKVLKALQSDPDFQKQLTQAATDNAILETTKLLDAGIAQAIDQAVEKAVAAATKQTKEQLKEWAKTSGSLKKLFAPGHSLSQSSMAAVLSPESARQSPPS